MPKKRSVRKELRDWKNRITDAKTYRSRFEKVAERNYEAIYGPLWKKVVFAERGTKVDVGSADNRYRHDMILSYLKTELSNLMYEIPEIHLTSRIKGEAVVEVTKQTQKEVNTIVREMDGLEDENESVLIDAHAFFGVSKTNFIPRYSDNPFAGRFIVEDGIETDVEEPKTILSEMSFDIARVNPFKFLVDSKAKNNVLKSAFVGEEVDTDLEQVRASDMFEDSEIDKIEEFLRIKSKKRNAWEITLTYYEIYNLLTKEMFVIVDGYADDYLKPPTPVSELGMEIHPYSILRYFNIPGLFYPVPEIWSGVHQQIDYNKVRKWEQDWVEKTPPKFGVVKALLGDEDSKSALEDADSMYVPVHNQGDVFKMPIDAPANINAKEHGERSKRDFDEGMNQPASARGNLEQKPEFAKELEIEETRSIARGGKKNQRTSKWFTKNIENILMYMDSFDYGALKKIEINPDVQIEIDLASRSPKNRETERNQLRGIAEVQPILLNSPTFMKMYVGTFDSIKDRNTIVDELMELLDIDNQRKALKDDKGVKMTIPLTDSLLALFPKPEAAMLIKLIAQKLMEGMGQPVEAGGNGEQPSPETVNETGVPEA